MTPEGKGKVSHDTTTMATNRTVATATGTSGLRRVLAIRWVGCYGGFNGWDETWPAQAIMQQEQESLRPLRLNSWRPWLSHGAAYMCATSPWRSTSLHYHEQKCIPATVATGRFATGAQSSASETALHSNM